MGEEHEADWTGVEQNSLWLQDNVSLRSVGIDIGSSGTQVLFSQIRLRRVGERLSSRYVVVSREQLFASPVEFTPFDEGRRIDGRRLGEILDRAYAEGRQRPSDIDTGVVILTGEALRRENAETISGIVARRGGTFVCAAAGHHLEATLAAHGSGAVARSLETGERMLNVDIGGGTTKLALVDAGRVTETSALHIGGRLLVLDDHGCVARLEPAARRHAAACGIGVELGQGLDETELKLIADEMATHVIAAIRGEALHRQAGWMDLTGAISELGDISGLMLSGGVAEYVYEREHRAFSDLGSFLGASVRERLLDPTFGVRLLEPGDCLRATAVGASQFSVQLSGNTSYVSDADRLFPRRDLPVVRPEGMVVAPEVDESEVARNIKSQRAVLGLTGPDREFVLALPWAGEPSYPRLSALALGIREGMIDVFEASTPVRIVMDSDVALSVGRLLRDELGIVGDLAVLDGLALWNFDYVDLGPIQRPSGTVPVTVKSLAFPSHHSR